MWLLAETFDELKMKVEVMKKPFEKIF